MKTIEELSKLSDEELRVMCAELCGWRTHIARDGVTYWVAPAEPTGYGAEPPEYATDLNSMREAWLLLSDGQHESFGIALRDQIEDEGFYFDDGAFEYGMMARIANATARQRCIAFIATKQGEEG